MHDFKVYFRSGLILDVETHVDPDRTTGSVMTSIFSDLSRRNGISGDIERFVYIGERRS